MREVERPAGDQGGHAVRTDVAEPRHDEPELAVTRDIEAEPRPTEQLQTLLHGRRLESEAKSVLPPLVRGEVGRCTVRTPGAGEEPVALGARVAQLYFGVDLEGQALGRQMPTLETHVRAWPPPFGYPPTRSIPASARRRQ